MPPLSMPITATQQRQLRIYLRFRGRRMTVAGLIWASRRVYALMFILFAAVAGLFYHFVGPAATVYVWLALAVAILRDIGYFRRSAKIWPVLDQVLDWNRIERFAGSAGVETETAG